MDARSALEQAIREDAFLAGVLEDRIFDRTVSRKGPMATPEAFDPSNQDMILPTVSVMDGGALPGNDVPGELQTVVTCWFRCSDSFDGGDLLSTVAEYTIKAFRETVIDLGGGRGAYLELADKFGAPVDPFVARCRFTYVRFRALEVL
jgi:hypothetical protein